MYVYALLGVDYDLWQRINGAFWDWPNVGMLCMNKCINTGWFVNLDIP